MRNVKLIFIFLFFLTSLGLAQSEASLSDSLDVYGDYMLGANEQLISMDLENADLVDVLKVLAQQTGLNFISTEIVRSRKLTLYLDQVPLKEALDTIFKANNLTYTFYPESKVFIVKEMGEPQLELKTKVYKLTNTFVKDSMIDKEVQDGLSRDTAKGDTKTAIESGSGDDSKNKDSGIIDSIKKVLSEYGTITSDTRTNSIIVTDMPSRFPLIDKIVEELDVEIPMVLIEVEMLDVEKAVVDQLGFKWGNGLNVSYSGPMKNTKWPLNTWSPPGISGLPTTPPTTGNFDMGLLSLASTNIVLQALTSYTSTKYLARPKVLTLSNHTAQIQIARDEAIGITSTSTESGSEQAQIEREMTGIILRVTPSVDMKTREITMFVEPKVVKAIETDAKIASLITGGVVKDPEQRSVASLLRMKDGQTLMIGGLIKEEETKFKSGVPILKNIPLLGALFRYKESAPKNKRELLVFITPKIVDNNNSLVSKDSMERTSREQTMSLQKQYAVETMMDSIGRYNY